jgi:hypothetical protein
MVSEMKMHTNVEVEITDEQMDKITLINLKGAYRLEAVPNRIDCSDDVIPVDEEMLDALNMVISYYSTREQYENWAKERDSL